MWNRFDDNATLEQVMGGVSYAAGRSYEYVLAATTDGQLHWMNTAADFSQSYSLNDIAPEQSNLSRNIIFSVAILVVCGAI